MPFALQVEKFTAAGFCIETKPAHVKLAFAARQTNP